MMPRAQADLTGIFWNDAPVRKGVTAPMTGPAGRAIVVGTRLIAPHGMRNLLNAMASFTFVAWAPVDWKAKGTKNLRNICVSSTGIVLGEARNQNWEPVGRDFLTCHAMETSLSDWNESSHVFLGVSAEDLHEIRKFGASASIHWRIREPWDPRLLSRILPWLG